VILLDVRMPDMDGFETAALIRARPRSKDTPIIFITAAFKTEDSVFQGYAAGAVDYIIKPVVPDILRSKVLVFVELARKTAELRRLNAKLEQQAADLAAANKELEAFSYSVSHDLRAPLRGIDGFSSMLARLYADKIDARGKELLERLQGSADRMARLIDARSSSPNPSTSAPWRGPSSSA
jgi:CheY-like chemotaxis protein